MRRIALLILLGLAICALGITLALFTLIPENQEQTSNASELAERSRDAFCTSVALKPIQCIIKSEVIELTVQGAFEHVDGWYLHLEGKDEIYSTNFTYREPLLSPPEEAPWKKVVKKIPFLRVLLVSPELRKLELERANAPDSVYLYVAALSDELGTCAPTPAPILCTREKPATNTSSNNRTVSGGGGSGGGGSGGGGSGGGNDGGNGAPPACNDTLDNDGDDLIDYPADPGCLNAEDTDESNTRSNLASSVTVIGPNDETIVFTFDQPREVGQYITGEWWVVGPTIITSITPDATAGCTSQDSTCRNGFMVNPTDVRENSFDGRTEGYDGSHLPALPYTAQPEDSIIKAISRTPEGLCAEQGAPDRQCLEFAAVLTIVAQSPENSANLFRPPFFGTDKPQTSFYLTDNVVTRLHKQVDLANTNIPPLSDIERRYRYLQLDFIQNFPSRHVVPYQNFYWVPEGASHDYWAEIAGDASTAAVRLLGNDFDIENEVHKRALVGYLQYGIDLYGVMEQRQGAWINHGNGRRLPVAFAAYAFNDAGMTSTVSNEKFEEDEQLRFSPVADGGNGFVLWGRAECSERDYWKRFWGSGGNRQCADPYGMIDGGSHEVGTTGGYQICCYSRNYKYEALAITLAEAESTWNFDEMIIYAERWVKRGTHAAPDSCAPYVAGTDGDGNGVPDNYGVDYGPAPGNAPDCHLTGTCTCIQDTNPLDGIGRFPERHGNNVDRGGYSRPYLDNVWAQRYVYRYF